MMECCNAYGQCVQGKDCAARTSGTLGAASDATTQFSAKVTKYHPRRRTSAELGVCQGRGDCTCAHPERSADLLRSPVPPEAGNMSIIDLGGDDDGEWDAVTLGDLWRWLRPSLLSLALLASILVLVFSVGVLTGYVTENHPEVLWTFLQGVS